MLNVNAMGLKLKNPVIISAGPWTRGRKGIRASLDTGAAAVVTETIVAEPYPDLCPRYAYDGRGLQNIRMYSALEMEEWIEEFKLIKQEGRKEGDGLIIANITAGTPSELAYLARKFEKAGVDALELGLACPMGEGTEIVAANPGKAYAFTKAVVDAVDIPVMVKLTHTMNTLPEVIASLEKAGAAGITAINTMRCILGIDVETGVPILPTYGGYSGSPIRPLGLATVAGIAQSTELPVFGIGGIENYKNVLEYIMLGASAAEVGTAVLVNGYGIIPRMIADLEAWMKRKGFSSLDEIRGTSLDRIYSFEELKVEPQRAYLKSDCSAEDCAKCVACCLDGAISFEGGKLVIDDEACTGCGLCLDICPDHKIGLRWKTL